MHEQPDTPFFPVPVRWFEIPMDTARWGFLRALREVEKGAEEAPSMRADRSTTASFATGSSGNESGGRVGRLLNERA